LGAATAAAAAFDPDEATRTSQAAIGRAVADQELLTDRGERLQLSTLRGRPVVVSMIYTSCLHVCAPTTLALKRAVGEARKALGESSFAVLSIGFDTRNDSPQRLAEFARSMRIEDPNWYFATAGSCMRRPLVASITSCKPRYSTTRGACFASSTARRSLARC
jgi:protein SCO1/2